MKSLVPRFFFVGGPPSSASQYNPICNGGGGRTYGNTQHRRTIKQAILRSNNRVARRPSLDFNDPKTVLMALGVFIISQRENGIVCQRLDNITERERPPHSPPSVLLSLNQWPPHLPPPQSVMTPQLVVRVFKLHLVESHIYYLQASVISVHPHRSPFHSPPQLAVNSIALRES